MTTIAIMGLGNPGPQYVGTRHNAGFWMMDQIASLHGCLWKESRRFHSLTTILKKWERTALLIKPLSFVNKSGSYIKPLLKYHDCQAEEMVVVYDDIAFEPGQMKISAEKGDGGHKGVRDIIRQIGPSFVRFRLGIGQKPEKMTMPAYVLSKFSCTEQAVMNDNFEFFAKVLQRIVDKGVTHAMNLSNKRIKSTDGQ